MDKTETINNALKSLLEMVARENGLEDYDVSELNSDGMPKPSLRFKVDGKHYRVELTITGQLRKVPQNEYWGLPYLHTFWIDNPKLILDPRRAQIRELQDGITRLEKQIAEEEGRDGA